MDDKHLIRDLEEACHPDSQLKREWLAKLAHRALVALNATNTPPADSVLTAEIKRACAYYKQAGRVACTSQMLAKQHEARADKIIEAALLAATPAPVAKKVPDGFVLVPKEPTGEMVKAAQELQWKNGSGLLLKWIVAPKVYIAMISAAKPHNEEESK